MPRKMPKDVKGSDAPAPPKVRFVAFDAVPVLQLESIGQIEEIGAGLKGAIVKVAITVKHSERAQLDIAEVADRVRSFGALAVTVVPKVVPDGGLTKEAKEEVQRMETPRESVSAWFAEMSGLSEAERASCIEMACAAIDSVEGM